MSERAVLAGGCFWGMQDLIRKMPGVLKTRVGYTGGDVPNATYRPIDPGFIILIRRKNWWPSKPLQMLRQAVFGPALS